MRSDTRVAVVGCGQWGRNLVRNFAELGCLAAVCDPDAETAAALAARYGVAACDFETLLADPSIDALAVAAPAARHYALALAGLEAGKHVFVEKPVALDLAEAERLCQLAERKNLRLMVGHLLQHHPVFIRLKEMVRSGELGRVQYIYSNRLNLGRFRREEDILWSFAPHDISMILSLIGEAPDRVEAIGGCWLHPTIADVTTTHLSFPNGERAHIFVSWLHPIKEQKLVVVGDRGMAVFNDGEPWAEKLMIYRHQIEWRDSLPIPQKAEGRAAAVPEGEPLRLECAHFLECVATGATPRTDGREGMRVLEVLTRASRAMTRDHQKNTAPPAPSPAPSAPSSTAPRHPGVHETACVDHPAVIGEGSRVWHFSHILPNTRIGRNCNIGQNVVIGPDVAVGDGCKIQNNVSIYKGVTLEDYVFCGPSCVFTNVLTPRAEVDRRNDFKPTLVRRGASIGANATIVCGVTLGEYCLIGAGAVVTRDVPAYALMVGSPARRIGWVGRAGERLNEDLTCPATGRRYRLADDETLEPWPDDDPGAAPAVGGARP